MVDSSRPIDGGVTLQISVAPADVAHAKLILPHQLRRWAAQVDEVLLVLDLGRTSACRSDPHRDDDKAADALLEELCERWPVARVARVDYGRRAAAELSERLCGGRQVPEKDCYGKAVYAYFFGLFAARQRYLLHLDADMLFGGGSDTWVAEARGALAQPGIFGCSPLPGPPSTKPMPRHVAIRHAGSRRRRALAGTGVALSVPGLHGPAFRFLRMSTRTFMLDLTRFADGGITLPVSRPGIRALLGAASKGALAKRNPLYAPAETSFTHAMRRLGLARVDFLGKPPGMWSLHPAVRDAAFYRALPEIIRRVEADEIPEEQRGDYDVTPSMLSGAGCV